ncbi:MAG TPA: hypothetical protein VNO70_08540 [Blastocatellia bacterium]|nr:hypothetical protein [Blastocatellia bacterium]
MVLIILAYILALPFLAVWAAVRLIKYLRLLKQSVSPALRCGNCRRPVALVGMWACQCGYTYMGHLMRPCPICRRVPKVARCYHCNVTTRLR